jgi:thymidylate synthase
VPETAPDGSIPVIHVVGDNLPEAWEKAIVACWERGASVRTEYDRTDSDGSFIDPPSRDATVIVEVRAPFAEPRLHKNFPGGPEELEVYRQEVVDGIHDHWVDPADPDKWTYTYHERIFAYKATTDLDDPAATTLPPVDQIAYAINKCAATHYSRRAQAITWIPNADPQTDDPPCLQRLWFRILMDGDEPVLNLNTHWRSRDGYKAWFMNAFALTDLQRVVAERIGEQLGRPVRIGRYVDISDSFHIYGSYFTEFEPEFAKMKAEPDYATRAWPSDHPAVQMMVDETRRKLGENVDYMRGDG